MAEMKINISSKSAEIRVTEILAKVQARCTARTISYADITDALEKAEHYWGIPKCHLDGTTVTVDVHGDNFPNAYKFVPESTIFSAVNLRGKWYITDIRRAMTRRLNARVCCTLSDRAVAALIQKNQQFCV